ncbi:hypothetical protein ACFEMC_15405 [Kineococcus sp. DHX-1]|uniref:hypothetical protein n=1 Tax=Kineococcus sp. DHX-1 TaxID=3349638 RepID=UPI0036D37524
MWSGYRNSAGSSRAGRRAAPARAVPRAGRRQSDDEQPDVVGVDVGQHGAVGPGPVGQVADGAVQGDGGTVVGSALRAAPGDGRAHGRVVQQSAHDGPDEAGEASGRVGVVGRLARQGRQVGVRPLVFAATSPDVRDDLFTGPVGPRSDALVGAEEFRAP